MASSRTPGRVLGPLFITGLLLSACRASSPAAPSSTPVVAPEPLASARAIRPSDIPRCQEDLLRLCADPLAALPEQSRSSRRSRREESGDEAPPAPPKPPTCEPGKAPECFGAAQAYEDEQGLRAALPAFVEACRQGSTPSCEHLAKAFQKDSESPAASACALAFASEACQLGSGEACVQRATAQDLPGGPAFDVTCGTAALEKACALGERGACADLPSAFSWPQRPALDAEALRQAEGACALGVAWACAFSARRHERGLGVPVDVSKALRLHEEACDLGSPTACLEGGLLRSEGQSTLEVVTQGEGATGTWRLTDAQGPRDVSLRQGGEVQKRWIRNAKGVLIAEPQRAPEREEHASEPPPWKTRVDDEAPPFLPEELAAEAATP